MPTPTFDTYKFVKTLQDTKEFTEVQAEAIFTAVNDSHAAADLSTKQYITESRQATQHDIAESRQATQHDIAELRRDMAELRDGIKRDMAELRQATQRDMKEISLRLTIWLGGLVFVAINTGPIISKLLNLF